MGRFVKLFSLLVAVAGICIALATAPRESSAAVDAGQVSKALATFNLGTQNASPVVQHGTHLCSAHSHCGTGHLCCSGHCKAVQTCG